MTATRYLCILVCVLAVNEVGAQVRPSDVVPFDHWAYDAANKIVPSERIRYLHRITIRSARDHCRFEFAMVLDELMRTATIITFHLPVTDETRRMVTRDHIESIRDGALVINSARTAVLDYEAFMRGLVEGRYRAVVDVYEPEPPLPDEPIRFLPNVVMTPHVAGSTSHMCRVCGRTAIDALRKWFEEES